MVALRLGAGVLVAFALLAPLAFAAPAHGALDVTGALTAKGFAQARSPTAAGVWNGTEAPDLVLDAASIHVEQIGSATTVQRTPALGDVVVNQNQDVDRAKDFGASRISFTSGNASQLVALRVSGVVDLNASQAQIRPVSAARLAEATQTSSLDPRACEDVVVGRCIGISGAYEIQTTGISGGATGTIQLLVRGPVMHVVGTDGKDVSFTSGPSTASSTGTVEQRETTWLLVRATGAKITFGHAAPKSLYAVAPTVDLTDASLDGASGRIAVGSSSYQAQGEQVQALGAVHMVLAPVAEGTSSFPGTRVAYAPSFQTEVSGDITQINLHETPVFVDNPVKTVGILAGVAGAVAALAYYWPIVSFHFAALVAPLYTRLRQPEILDNDVRNRIYDIIRTNPGIAARSVHRESGQSWGTVVYHLRQLERHHLVVSRTLGRTRNYYENHGKYKGMEIQLATLQAPRALILARAILDTPGLTQEGLVEASGYPQPTASYYVRKLRKAGLIDEVREGRYVRYMPAGDLERFVSTAETAHPGFATTGVQA